MTEWWDGDPDERYWVEITARDDIGVDLHAPSANEKLAPFWSYELLRKPLAGHIVYHYDGNSQAIIGYSEIVGEPWDDRIVWAAQGTSARKQGIVPHLRDGIRRGLGGFVPLEAPLTKARLIENRREMIAIRDAIAARGKPSRFPFIPYGDNDLRAIQGYLTKLPQAVLELFPELRPKDHRLVTTTPGAVSASALGTSYRRANEVLAVSERDPFAVDPALVERALRGHAATQNLLAAHIAANGATPLSPVPGGPNYDLAWQSGEEFWVAEVKSCTALNQENQLRLGLGQVLRYRSILSTTLGRPVRAMLVVEVKPRDPAWLALCADLDVDLRWPDLLVLP